MTDLFINFYNYIGENNKTFFFFRYSSAKRFLVRSIANIILPIYYTLFKHSSKNQLNNSNSNSPKIIVSLTSFPKRINRLWIVIETILRQTKKPDLIVLWLSKKQFTSLESLPKQLLRLQYRGLKIVLVDEDYRSHKKYYYILKNYPNDYIITVDDDIFYSKHLISSLWKKHLQYPEAVICNYAFLIERDKNKNIIPYQEWKEIKSQSSPSSNIFFGSGGGTLFPPDSFHQDVLNPELFMELCIHADDIWLNTMVRLNKKKVAKNDVISTILPLQYKNDNKLASINLIDGKNDIQLAMVRDFYFQKLKIDPYESE